MPEEPESTESVWAESPRAGDDDIAFPGPDATQAVFDALEVPFLLVLMSHLQGNKTDILAAFHMTPHSGD